MKLIDLDILRGDAIKSFKMEDNTSVLLQMRSGKNYRINLYDESNRGNDSHATIGSVDISNIIGETIDLAQEESKDSREAVLIFKDINGETGIIKLYHDHNGYYNFSYDVEEV